MKKSLFLLLTFTSFLHAETQDEFAARITAAWESKDPDKMMALYNEPEKLDPQFEKIKRSTLEHQLKTCRLKSVIILGFLMGDKNPKIQAGKIIQLPANVSKSAYIEISSSEGSSYSASVIPIFQDKDEKFWFANAVERPFEWNGPGLNQYWVHMSYEGSHTPCPEALALIESCGYVNWAKFSGNSGGFWAHKISQIIVPPTPEGDSITFKISKDGGEPFFTKTVNTTKGAIIPIEAPAP